MTLPLSAHAREAVDRIAARRKRERDLQVRRDTAVRARILKQEMEEIAARVAERWSRDANPPMQRHSTDGIPGQVIAYLHENGEAHTSRLALALNRQYDGVKKALHRLEATGEVAWREDRGTKWWRLTYQEPAVRRPVNPNVKLDREELVGFVEDNPGCTLYEAAVHFGAHQESVGRRLRELRREGRVTDVMVDRSAPAQWFAAGAVLPAVEDRALRWDDLVLFVRGNPGCTTNQVAAGTGGRPESVRRALNKLTHSGRVRNRAAGAPVARWEVPS